MPLAAFLVTDQQIGATNAATRGLGSLASSAGSYVFGIVFTNISNTIIDQFEIEIIAAQWRKGGSGKSGEWTFSYATSPTNNVLDTITKKDTALNFYSVQTSTGTSALNGLLTINQQQKKRHAIQFKLETWRTTYFKMARQR